VYVNDAVEFLERFRVDHRFRTPRSFPALRIEIHVRFASARLRRRARTEVTIIFTTSECGGRCRV